MPGAPEPSAARKAFWFGNNGCLPSLEEKLVFLKINSYWSSDVCNRLLYLSTYLSTYVSTYLSTYLSTLYSAILTEQ